MYIQWRLERVQLEDIVGAGLVESINMPCLVKEDMGLSKRREGRRRYMQANSILLYTFIFEIRRSQ